DGFTVALLCEGREQLIYKHAISTVSPARRLELREPEARESIEI
ncbi:MAG: RNA chaperone Hfq, partial [Oscillospiraceae bacterium]|nr:RNA chaperone Hfq [Oscillospiraceae bacterium]